MASIIEEQIKKMDNRLNVLECGQSLGHHLNNIKRSIKLADTKFNLAFAITVMTIAYEWLTDDITHNNTSAIIIGILGILLLLGVFCSPLIEYLRGIIRSRGNNSHS